MIYIIIHDNAPSVVNHEPSAETYLCIILQYSVVNYTFVLYSVKWNSYQYALIEEFYITFNSTSCVRWHWILFKYEIEYAYCLSSDGVGLYNFNMMWANK